MRTHAAQSLVLVLPNTWGENILISSSSDNKAQWSLPADDHDPGLQGIHKAGAPPVLYVPAGQGAHAALVEGKEPAGQEAGGR